MHDKFLSLSISRYFWAILKFKFTSYTIWVFFAPFIATLKISTAISVLLLLLILTPPPRWSKNNLCEIQHFKNILKRIFLSVTKILILYRFPFYITISLLYKISSYRGKKTYEQLIFKCTPKQQLMRKRKQKTCAV